MRRTMNLLKVIGKDGEWNELRNVPVPGNLKITGAHFLLLSETLAFLPRSDRVIANYLFTKFAALNTRAHVENVVSLKK